MKFGWENDEDRLSRFMRIPPMRKMEWLQQMNEFTRKFMSKQRRTIWRKLREGR